MRSSDFVFGAIFTLFFAIQMVPSRAATEPVIVSNPGTAVNPDRVKKLTEKWRAGVENEDVFFGQPGNSIIDDRGHLYLLDRQLNQVFEFDSNGSFVQSLGREGEGPGEFRRPQSLILLPEKKLGVLQQNPAKIVVLDRSGLPAGTITPSGAGFGENMVSCNGVELRAGSLVFCGQVFLNQKWQQFLSLCSPDGTEKSRLMTQARNVDFRRRLYVEKDEDFVSDGRWTIGPDGHVFVAENRNRYEIKEYDETGTLVRLITRKFESRLRTDEELEKLASMIIMFVDGERVQIESILEDTPPCISDMKVMSNGDLWVLNNQGTTDLSDGGFQKYDVFSGEGKFLQEVEVVCPSAEKADSLEMIGDGLFLLIRGLNIGQAASTDSENSLENEEVQEVEIVFFES